MTGRPVRVAVDALADRPERTFTYVLPEALGPPSRARSCSCLTAAALPSGTSSRIGRPRDDGAELRDVEAVVSEPMLTPDLLALAEEVAAYYRAPIGTTLASMLPPGLESRLKRTWHVIDAEATSGRRRDWRLGPTRTGSRTRPAAARAAEGPRGVARTAAPVGSGAGGMDPASARGRPTTGPDPPPGRADLVAPRRAPLQAALLAAIASGERTFPELADELAVDASRLLAPARGLPSAALPSSAGARRTRDALAHRARRAPATHGLASEQGAAVEAIARMAPGGELLLEGVAAAGKTDVYLAALDPDSPPAAPPSSSSRSCPAWRSSSIGWRRSRATR